MFPEGYGSPRWAEHQLIFTPSHDFELYIGQSDPYYDYRAGKAQD
jgi:hypothetical protein